MMPATGLQLTAGCGNCKARGLCLPKDLSPRDLERVDALVGIRRKVKRGEALLLQGEKFANLYAIRTGFFKTSVSTHDGRELGRGLPKGGGSRQGWQAARGEQGQHQAACCHYPRLHRREGKCRGAAVAGKLAGFAHGDGPQRGSREHQGIAPVQPRRQPAAQQCGTHYRYP